MQQIRPDLWETATETPMPGLTTHAYLLTRETGNLLFYNTSLRQEIERMNELGGVAYQFLSHRDELGDSLIRQRLPVAVAIRKWRTAIGMHCSSKPTLVTRGVGQVTRARHFVEVLVAEGSVVALVDQGEYQRINH